MVTLLRISIVVFLGMFLSCQDSKTKKTSSQSTGLVSKPVIEDKTIVSNPELRALIMEDIEIANSLDGADAFMQKYLVAGFVPVQDLETYPELPEWKRIYIDDGSQRVYQTNSGVRPYASVSIWNKTQRYSVAIPPSWYAEQTGFSEEEIEAEMILLTEKIAGIHKGMKYSSGGKTTDLFQFTYLDVEVTFVVKEESVDGKLVKHLIHNYVFSTKRTRGEEL